MEPSTRSGQHGTDVGSVPALAPGLDSSDTAKAITGTGSSATEMRRYISRPCKISPAKPREAQNFPKQRKEASASPRFSAGLLYLGPWCITVKLKLNTNSQAESKSFLLFCLLKKFCDNSFPPDWPLLNLNRIKNLFPMFAAPEVEAYKMAWHHPSDVPLALSGEQRCQPWCPGCMPG